MADTVSLAAQEISVAETAGQVLVTFKRTGDLSTPVTITYGVTDDTAVNGVDYTAPAFGDVTIPVGQDHVSITIPIINDTLSEATEAFVVSIVGVDPDFLTHGIILAPRTARVSILDDENPVQPPVDPPLVSNFNVTLQPVSTGFELPIKFEFLPTNAARAIVGQKDGLIQIVDMTSGAHLSTFLDLRSQVNAVQDRGLIDMAFSPDLATKPYFYVTFAVDPAGTAGNGLNGVDGSGNRFVHLDRYTLDAATNYTTIVANSKVTLVGNAGQTFADISGNGNLDFTNPTNAGAVSSEKYIAGGQTASTVVGGFKQNYWKVDSLSHIGGAIAFGPDGNLYVSTGDGTSFDYADPRTPDVLNVNSLSGKVLRLDPVTGQGLADNPFAAGASLDSNAAKVWQLGLRNPFAMGFSPDGQLFISNTGWNSYEMIESGPEGANFGWPYFEGGDGGVLVKTATYKDFAAAAAFYQQQASGAITITPAYRAFAHDSALPGYQVQAITAGDVVYSGDKYPGALTNDFFFADVVDGEVYSVDVYNRQELQFLYKGADIGMTDFKQGPDGYVYYVDLSHGVIGRFLITGGGNTTPPVAVNDTAVAVLNTPLQIAPATLLANDTDADGSALTLTGVSNPVNGTVALAGGQVVFTPAAGFTGAASFNYTVSDGVQNAVGTVAVTVRATALPQLALSGNATKPGADTYQLTPALGDQLGGAMSAQRLDVRQNFTLTFDVNFGADDAGADGVGFVLHNDPRGAATIGYGGSNLGLNSIVNGLGIAFDTYQNADRGDIATDSASWMDTDAQTQTARISLGNVEDGTFKRVVVSWNATTHALSYSLNGATIATITDANFTQTYLGGSNFAYFGFTAATGGAVNTQTVRLIDAVATFEGGGPVGAAPVAVADTFAATEDTALPVLAARNVLTNDTDTDTPAANLTAVLDTTTTKGTLVLNANGTFSYTPLANANGVDTFTYHAYDGANASAPVTVTINVAPVNDAPVAGADTLTTAQNTAIVTPVATLLANDTDVDNNPLTLTAVSNATNGTVGLAGGQVTFTPTTGFTGAATYQYTVNDGVANATGTVTVNVGAAATLPQLTINGNATKPAANTYQLTPADNDQQGGATSAVRLDIRQNFTIGFDMNFGANDAGADGMGFVLHNDARGAAAAGYGGANLGLISIVNGFGIAFDTYQNADRGDIATDSASWVDTDAATQTARISLGNVEDGLAKHIVVSWNAATQTISYTLNGAAIATLTQANFAQTYLGGSNFAYFGFTGTTGGAFNTQSVKLTDVVGTFEGAGPTNNPPTVVGETLATTTNTALVVTAASLLVNDSDPDGDPLTLTAVSGAVNGSVALVGGQVTFTPTAGFNGAGSFQYTVSDGKTGLTNGTVTVNVAPAAGATPVAVADAFAATEDTALPVLAARNVLANDTDADTPTANLIAVLDTTTTHGALVLNANGTFSYTPVANYNGVDTFTYHANDGVRSSAPVTVTLNIAAVNDTPVAGADTIATTTNTALVTPAATLLANDTDVDNNPLTLTAVSGAVNGTVALAGGQVTFTPTAGFTGAGSFQYTVNDGAANATGTVTVNIGAAATLPQLTIGGNATNPAANTYQLTPADNDQLGQAMSAVRLDVRQNFTIGFDANFGANDAGADGIGFVLHNDPRGAATIGYGGANLGLISIVNGLGIAFDTYQNADRGDIATDSASWVDTDAQTQTTRISLGNIEDGLAKHVVVSWNAATQTLSYTLNGAEIASLTNATFAQTYFGGSNFAYFGFTGATGGAFNTQSIKLTDVVGTFEAGGATNHAPVIAYNGGANTTLNILENQNLLLAKVLVTDSDNDAITYALSGADAAKFSISAGGDLRLLAAPNYEAPTDQGANNQYVVTVTVKDVANAVDTITYTVNVADVAEGTAIQGTATGQTVTGSAASNILIGLGGNDTVNGQAGNDTIVATLTDGNDTYNGGADSDTLDMSAMTVAATINLTTGTATSTQSGTDTLTAIENAIGGSGADTITGSASANRLSGGVGADTLTGAAGSDTFVFGAGFGADKITDFGDVAGNQDMIDFAGFGFTDVASVLTHVVQTGADTVIDLGGGNVLTLAGFTAANFGVDDFFV
jgi:VCBS repeat-containing protein